MALRDDGVIFQFGGQQSTPAQIDKSAIVPLQPDKVILTGIDYLYYENGGNVIIVITSANEAYILYPDYHDQPIAIIDPV